MNNQKEHPLNIAKRVFRNFNEFTPLTEMVDTMRDALEEAGYNDELESAKSEYKEGDFCVAYVSHETTLCVFINRSKKLTEKSVPYGIPVYAACFLMEVPIVIDDSIFLHKETKFRLADDNEKFICLHKLRAIGYKWNAQKMKLEKLDWLPVVGEYVYTPLFVDQFAPSRDRWTNTFPELLNYGRGWVFQTLEECKSFCDKLNAQIFRVLPETSE